MALYQNAGSIHRFKERPDGRRLLSIIGFSVTVTPAQLHALVQKELEGIRDARVVKHIRNLLVEPQVFLRSWDYGADGEAYPCWSVLDHVKSSTGIGYCEFGFGPECPWGLVGLAGSAHQSLGMDSGWFSTFVEAFFESAAVTDLPIWRVFKQGAGPYPGVALTTEADWDSTWERVYALRASDPDDRYHCAQDIWFRSDA